MSASMNGPLTPSPMVSSLKTIVPPLSPSAHKGQAGRIGIVGGSVEYTGAPFYAAIAALRLGADLAHIFCMKEAATAIKSYSPEVIVHPVLDGPDPMSEIEEWLPRLHTLVVGPGLGRRPQTFATLGHILSAAKDRNIGIVIDADALFYLNENFDVIQDYEEAILTPNKVECARLYRAVCRGDMRADDINPDHVQMIARKLGVTVACKGMGDVIATRDVLLHCNTEGGLRRCGGQGDILSGATALFLHWATATARSCPESLSGGVPPTALAAYWACALTRRTASLTFEQEGRGMITSDMISRIPKGFESLLTKGK